MTQENNSLLDKSEEIERNKHQVKPTQAQQRWPGVCRSLVVLHIFGLGVALSSWSSQRYDPAHVSLKTEAEAPANVSLRIASPSTRSPAWTPAPTTPTTTSIIPIANMSVLHYQACCGLGHRLARQCAAYHAAHRLGFRLEVEWNNCGTNVFDELFDPETQQELAYVNSTNQRYSISNEVTGYWNAFKNCLPDELESNYQMYSSLRRRFRQKASVNEFVRAHFEHKLVVGIHVRAGNGEGGDFAEKGREVDTTAQNFTQLASQHIRQLLLQQSTNTTTTTPMSNTTPVLFVATDTAEYVDLLRSSLRGVMDVVTWDQAREDVGTGVFLGQG